jgi:hypothetical protein
MAPVIACILVVSGPAVKPERARNQRNKNTVAGGTEAMLGHLCILRTTIWKYMKNYAQQKLGRKNGSQAGAWESGIPCHKKISPKNYFDNFFVDKKIFLYQEIKVTPKE